MKRTALTILGAAGLVTAALGGTANAAPIPGSFGFAPTNGNITVNTGNIALNTATKMLPATLAINTTPTGSLTGIANGDTIVLTAVPANTLPVQPAGAVTPFTIMDTTHPYTFSFDTGELIGVITPTGTGTAGGFLDEYTGTVTAGATAVGQTVLLSESCNQATTGGTINCSDTITTPSPVTLGVPEPASMALFGSALVGFGAFRRRRKTS